MDRDTRRLDGIRAQRTELENHVVDELVAGRLDRREFIRRGSVIGMSMTTMGALLSACGGANDNLGSTTSEQGGTPATGEPTRGGRLKISTQVPTAAINPVTLNDGGALLLLAQAGDFLCIDNLGHEGEALKPSLATSWSPNKDSTVWTFKLRPNVKFHDGQVMDADDVVYSFKNLSDPDQASNALSAYSGILSPDGVRKVDDMTVAFHLEAAMGSFPYLVSSDVYNSVVVPDGTDYEGWQKTFLGTGPWKMKNYDQGARCVFEANPDYWNGAPYLDEIEFRFYPGQPPQILAMQGGQLDVISSFAPQGAQALISKPEFTVMQLESAIHQQLSMRTDKAPFDDARVRRAIALALERPALVEAMAAGMGQVGNDSPFAPIYPSTDTSIPQREQDLEQAKQLLADAGHPDGFTTQMFAPSIKEVPQLAQAIAAEAAKIGVTIELKMETQAAYYGKSTFGDSDWLDGIMSLGPYAGRGIPNVVLKSAFTSDGTWNAARFKNAEFDNLYTEYIAVSDVQTQKAIARKMQKLLLDETPVIIPYFLSALTLTKKNVHGVFGTQTNNQIFLDKAYVD
jgi:peptide/nickel transport system substrate-binding protein